MRLSTVALGIVPLLAPLAALAAPPSELAPPVDLVARAGKDVTVDIPRPCNALIRGGTSPCDEASQTCLSSEAANPCVSHNYQPTRDLSDTKTKQSFMEYAVRLIPGFLKKRSQLPGDGENWQREQVDVLNEQGIEMRNQVQGESEFRDIEAGLNAMSAPERTKWLSGLIEGIKRGVHYPVTKYVGVGVVIATCLAFAVALGTHWQSGWGALGASMGSFVGMAVLIAMVVNDMPRGGASPAVAGGAAVVALNVAIM